MRFAGDKIKNTSNRYSEDKGTIFFFSWFYTIPFVVCFEIPTGNDIVLPKDICLRGHRLSLIFSCQKRNKYTIYTVQRSIKPLMLKPSYTLAYTAICYCCIFFFFYTLHCTLCRMHNCNCNCNCNRKRMKKKIR